MHSSLTHQLEEYGGALERPPERWEAFLQAVSDGYAAADRDRAQLRQEISDRQRIEIELRLKQKLESVGQLAAGIAHELNTPVQYLGDSVHFIRSAFDDYRGLLEEYRTRCTALSAGASVSESIAALAALDEEADLGYLDEQVPRAFDRIFDGTRRVASIVGAVKDFAHPDRRTQAPADLNRGIESTLIVARNEYKHIAEVETAFGELPEIECNIGDLNQVFLNLIVNAAHAIADRARAGETLRGRIRIVTRVEHGEAIVAVSDTGCGIPEGIRDKVFDPFFTTKEVGRGAGQGLAICRAIVVEKHGGSLSFDTRVGEGTTFVVRLPVNGLASSAVAA